MTIDASHSLLKSFIDSFSKGLQFADAERPQNGKFSPGIGPFTEDETVARALAAMDANALSSFEHETQVSYPCVPRQKCDVRIRDGEHCLYIEVKMMRLLGNNGKLNNNMCSHIISPYDKERSALTDIAKLKKSGFEGDKAIVIYGYDYDDYPLELMIRNFEVLAGSSLGSRLQHDFANLVHPVHQRGATYGWIITQ